MLEVNHNRSLFELIQIKKDSNKVIRNCIQCNDKENTSQSFDVQDNSENC